MSHSVTLVVVRPFADYQRGDQITDPDVVRKVLSTHAHHCLRLEPVEAKS